MPASLSTAAAAAVGLHTRDGRASTRSGSPAYVDETGEGSSDGFVLSPAAGPSPVPPTTSAPASHRSMYFEAGSQYSHPTAHVPSHATPERPTAVPVPLQPPVLPSAAKPTPLSQVDAPAIIRSYVSAQGVEEDGAEPRRSTSRDRGRSGGNAHAPQVTQSRIPRPTRGPASNSGQQLDNHQRRSGGGGGGGRDASSTSSTGSAVDALFGVPYTRHSGPGDVSFATSTSGTGPDDTLPARREALKETLTTIAGRGGNAPPPAPRHGPPKPAAGAGKPSRRDHDLSMISAVSMFDKPSFDSSNE